VAQRSPALRSVQDAGYEVVRDIPPGSTAVLGHIHRHILQFAADGLENRQGVQRGAGRGPEQFDLQCRLLMTGPEALDDEAGSVGEANETPAVVVRVVLAPIVPSQCGPGTEVSFASGSELGSRHSGHRDGSGQAHNPPGRIEIVDPHVPESASALPNKAQVPVGNATPPDTARFSVVDFAEDVGLGQVAQILYLRGETGGKRHHVDHAGRFRGSDQFLRRRYGIRQRFGHHDMLVVADGLQGHRYMPLVGRTHKNRIHLGMGAHRLVVGKAERRVLRKLHRRLLHPGGQQIAERDHPAAGITGQRHGIGAANAHAYDAHSDLFHGSTSSIGREMNATNEILP